MDILTLALALSGVSRISHLVYLGFELCELLLGDVELTGVYPCFVERGVRLYQLRVDCGSNRGD